MAILIIVVVQVGDAGKLFCMWTSKRRIRWLAFGAVRLSDVSPAVSSAVSSMDGLSE
jgi:hypothetical protein